MDFKIVYNNVNSTALLSIWNLRDELDSVAIYYGQLEIHIVIMHNN